MKVLTITGTRPELIRLSLIIKKLDKLVNHILVYTNQNYDYNLSTIFFDQLQIRQPDYYFDFKYNSFGEFLGKSVMEFEKILLTEKPDKILVLGDTNSGLLSIVGEKYKIPIYHMEAGNRCYDNRLPEETNRRIIDNVSTYNLPYTEGSKQILLDEKFDKNHVFKTGNPIYEVLNYYEKEISKSDILDRLDIKDLQYVLVTAHRTENVDNEETLKDIVKAINKIADEYVVVFSVHPRTKDKINKFGVKTGINVIVSEPFGFFDFVKLEMNAMCVISDSGTVQEETCIFQVPAITIRETTERRETVECGSNILCGTKYNDIMESFNIIINTNNTWKAPQDYLVENVSDIIINILSGKK
jgi:UDP-N-acetylglucosamine 2-epimerase (non-hydrolysing)